MQQLLRNFKRRLSSVIQTKEERRHALVGPAQHWKMKRDFQVRFLRDMGLEPAHYLLEIGCGTLRGGVPLIRYLENSHYYGTEVRAKVLDEGRKELRDAALEFKNPTLLLTPFISQLNINKKFDYIWAFSVLIHMNDNILNDALSFVSKHLSEHGVFYANVNIGDRKEGIWQGFPVVTRTFGFYSDACATHGLVVSDLGPLIDLGHRTNIDSQDNQIMLKIQRRA